MKLKKMLKMSLAVALVFGTAGTIVGCGKDDDKTAQKTQEEKVYDLYVSYMSAQGETPLTYEEWYATLKGAKGDKGDTGATGAPGAAGQNGKDGATWHYGTASVIDVNLGKTGDFYFNTSTQSIYAKTSGGWELQTTIEDGTSAVAPQIKIDPDTKMWTISTDGGANWTSTGVKAVGTDGENGKGIAAIEKTDTKDNIDTYTITYTDNTTSLFRVINGIDGENGEDGKTWHTGEGEPTLRQDLEAKEGDFYFDTLDNEIYLYDGENWISQVDLTEDVVETEKLVLKADTYTGHIHGYPFTVVIKDVLEGETVVGQEIESLVVDGLEDVQMGPNLVPVVTNPTFTINDDNEVVLTMDILDEYKSMATQSAVYETTTRYLKLVGENVFELSTNDVEEDLLKGLYIGNSSFLNVAGENFALSYNGTNLKGTWKAVDGDRESGEYMLELSVDGRVITANVDYFNREFYLNVKDFSATYTMPGETEGETMTIVFDADAEASEKLIVGGTALTYSGEYEFDDSSTKLYVEYSVGEVTSGFVLDYISGSVVGINIEGDLPLFNEGHSVVAVIDSNGEGIKGYYYVNSRDKLERYNGYVMTANDEYVVYANLYENSVELREVNDYSYVAGRISIYEIMGEITQDTQLVCEDQDNNVRFIFTVEEGEYTDVTVEKYIDVSAESIYQSVERNSSYLVENYYNVSTEKFAELTDNLENNRDNLYTYVGQVGSGYNTLEINNKKYAINGEIAVSLGMNNQLVMDAWLLTSNTTPFVFIPCSES